jgi:hypothetical protein
LAEAEAAEVATHQVTQVAEAAADKLFVDLLTYHPFQ